MNLIMKLSRIVLMKEKLKGNYSKTPRIIRNKVSFRIWIWQPEFIKMKQCIKQKKVTMCCHRFNCLTLMIGFNNSKRWLWPPWRFTIDQKKANPMVLGTLQNSWMRKIFSIEDLLLWARMRFDLRILAPLILPIYKRRGLTKKFSNSRNSGTQSTAIINEAISKTYGEISRFQDFSKIRLLWICLVSKSALYRL